MQGRYLQHSGQNSPTLLFVFGYKDKKAPLWWAKKFLQMENTPVMTSAPLIQRNILLLFFRYCAFEKRPLSFFSTFLDPFQCR